MTKPGDICPKCSGAMESGFILDTVFLGTPFQSKWVEGEPKYSWLVPGLTLRSRRVRKVITYRCQECGFLESYARHEALRA